MYILKFKHGPNIGKYVGAKRGHRYKIEEDINRARVFLSIGGVKSFYGTKYPTELYKKILQEYSDWTKRREELNKIKKVYTKDFELLEINIKLNNNEKSI